VWPANRARETGIVIVADRASPFAARIEECVERRGGGSCGGRELAGEVNDQSILPSGDWVAGALACVRRWP
jgi:hypothetical protein